MHGNFVLVEQKAGRWKHTGFRTSIREDAPSSSFSGPLHIRIAHAHRHTAGRFSNWPPLPCIQLFVLSLVALVP